MKIIILLIFGIYMIISGILYFRMHWADKTTKEVNFVYILVNIITFIVFIFWGWILYPYALIKKWLQK
jgi:uncharacterized membrane protein YesL